MTPEDRSNPAQEPVQRAMEAKSHFLASMSHELRTPIHGILSFAEFGLREAETAPRQDLHQYFHHIHESGSVLLALLNDLLDFTKLLAGRMSFNKVPLDLGALTSNLADEFGPRFQEKGVELQHEEPTFEAFVQGDEQRLAQMLRHLLGNSLRCARSRVTLGLEVGTGGAATILVRDNRRPIPEEDLESLMDPLATAERSRNQPGSTELGLPIARGIVSAHGGTISVESSEQGTCFYVRMKLKEFAGSPAGAEDAKAA